MPFDPTPITNIRTQNAGFDLFLQWDSSAPSGFWTQIYVGGKLAWYGTDTETTLPAPSDAGTTWVEVGVVPAAERSVDFSATLPTTALNRVRLTWPGGTYLDPDGHMAGFDVFAGTAPGGAVSYAKPVGYVPVASAVTPADGAGMGGAGMGGAGAALGTYTWTGGPYQAGTWHFGVRSLDSAQNLGDAREATVVVPGPPRAPAPNSLGIRLSLTYSASSRQATLRWAASPA